jgi:phosphate/sulfate permease
MMMSVAVSTFSFTLLSTYAGMPISGTHTIVGSLIGAGLIGVGASNINYGRLKRIVI